MEEKKSIYGLIGYPLGHSLSPIMHNTAFAELRVDAEYRIFPLKEDELQDFFMELRETTSPIFGLNVTVPYKEKVIPFLDTLSPFAQKVKAVNTIVISEDRKLTGFNTDGPGFLTHLAEIGFNPERKRVSVLGAGGAARAILSVLCLIPERPESIKVFDIDIEKADFLVRDLGQRFDVSNVNIVNSIDDLNIELADLLVNATPLGLRESDPCIVSEELLHSNLFVYDLIYNPSETKLLQLAKQKEAKVSNGLGMLFYQGVLAFQHWANTELDDVVKTKMRESLTERLNDAS